MTFPSWSFFGRLNVNPDVGKLALTAWNHLVAAAPAAHLWSRTAVFFDTNMLYVFSQEQQLLLALTL